MSLYLCVFASDDGDGDSEIDGIDVGAYRDYGEFRATIVTALENGRAGSHFPVLTGSPDSDTDWSPEQCRRLRGELEAVITDLRRYPAPDYPTDSWQRAVADELGLVPESLAEWFIDVDGEPLLARLYQLAAVAVDLGRPISFM